MNFIEDAESNAKYCSEYFKEGDGLEYYPLDKSNDLYNYNINRVKLQEELGNNYFVPKIFLFKRKNDGQIVTLSVWTEHTPNVFPPVDYFLISKNYKKFFSTTKESGLISAKAFNERFGSLLEDFDFKNCRIIRTDNARKAKDLFNDTRFEFQLNDFGERTAMDKLVNNR